MLNPVHVVLRASMFNQAHSTSNMSWDTTSSCAFHALLWSELGEGLNITSLDDTPRMQVTESPSPMSILPWTARGRSMHPATTAAHVGTSGNQTLRSACSGWIYRKRPLTLPRTHPISVARTCESQLLHVMHLLCHAWSQPRGRMRPRSALQTHPLLVVAGSRWKLCQTK